MAPQPQGVQPVAPQPQVEQPSAQQQPQAPQPIPPAKTDSPAEPAAPRPTKPLSPFTTISIKSAPKPEFGTRISIEVKPLTEETVVQYWKEAAEKLGLDEIMKEGIPHLGEHPGSFEVDAQTVGFTDDFKPHKIDVMEFFREKTGMKMLDCKVNPRFVEKTEVVYSPDDKYAAMLAANPHMAELRKLFPMIDY